MKKGEIKIFYKAPEINEELDMMLDDYEYIAFTIITLAAAVGIANLFILLHMKYGILNWLINRL